MTVGFIVRPFGALFFGRIVDLVGRKYAFLVTLLIMGGATALIGVLPTFATIGFAAPLILILIRVLQGLALQGQPGDLLAGECLGQEELVQPSRISHAARPGLACSGPRA